MMYYMMNAVLVCAQHMCNLFLKRIEAGSGREDITDGCCHIFNVLNSIHTSRSLIRSRCALHNQMDTSTRRFTSNGENLFFDDIYSPSPCRPLPLRNIWTLSFSRCVISVYVIVTLQSADTRMSVISSTYFCLVSMTTFLKCSLKVALLLSKVTQRKRLAW